MKLFSIHFLKPILLYEFVPRSSIANCFRYTAGVHQRIILSIGSSSDVSINFIIKTMIVNFINLTFSFELRNAQVANFLSKFGGALIQLSLRWLRVLVIIQQLLVLERYFREFPLFRVPPCPMRLLNQRTNQTHDNIVLWNEITFQKRPINEAVMLSAPNHCYDWKLSEWQDTMSSCQVSFPPPTSDVVAYDNCTVFLPQPVWKICTYITKKVSKIVFSVYCLCFLSNMLMKLYELFFFHV